MLHKAIYRFSATLSKYQRLIPSSKNNPKICRESQMTPNNQSNFEEEERKGIILPDFQLCAQSSKGEYEYVKFKSH